MAAYPLLSRTESLRHRLARQSENPRRRPRARPCDEDEPPNAAELSNPFTRLISASRQMPTSA
jgi:hypothetical protein